MISRGNTSKRIKEIVDARANHQVKLKKPFECTFKEGAFNMTTKRTIASLRKNGNSIMWIDDTYAERNINMLDTADLHKILWQMITEKEKMEIALEHLYVSKKYLER